MRGQNILQILVHLRNVEFLAAMEELQLSAPLQGIIACCECCAPIQPNAANMCIGCVRSKVDITSGITKQSAEFFVGFEF